jgi:hypothetical protein
MGRQWKHREVGKGNRAAGGGGRTPVPVLGAPPPRSRHIAIAVESFSDLSGRLPDAEAFFPND